MNSTRRKGEVSKPTHTHTEHYSYTPHHCTLTNRHTMKEENQKHKQDYQGGNVSLINWN